MLEMNILLHLASVDNKRLKKINRVHYGLPEQIEIKFVAINSTDGMNIKKTYIKIFFLSYPPFQNAFL